MVRVNSGCRGQDYVIADFGMRIVDKKNETKNGELYWLLTSDFWILTTDYCILTSDF
jgi:hypothetical protein